MTVSVFASMMDVLRHRAATRPGDQAYVFLADRGGEIGGLTYGELDRRARAIAGELVRITRPGDRGLLLFSPGLDLLAAFFGCLYAGVVAVPVVPPRHDRLREAIAGIVGDCRPGVALTTAFVADRARAEIDRYLGATGIRWLVVDAPEGPSGDSAVFRHHDLAFLQYTSGSTSAPKGVMVRHANLLANLEMARVAFGVSPRSTYVSWVPLHHDLGLILNALASVYAGARCVLMAPVTFMQRPLSWLRAIHDYRADVAGGPNFAFDLCARRFRTDAADGLDLSCWRVAFNGAEPVHADTIQRFSRVYASHGFAPEAMYPCYGMAEATVLISAGRRGDAVVTRTVSRGGIQAHRIRPPGPPGDERTIVSCGRALPGEPLAIIDPVESRRAGPDEVGEIWVRGPHLAGGYWEKPGETAATFQARITGEDESAWLRTGDLGWIDAAGDLFITGRLKDLIVIRGTNFYPQDIERTVQASHPALRHDGGAAFSVEDEHGDERLVVVQEVERSVRHAADVDEIVEAVRAAVVREHELTIQALVLVRPGTVPKTSSGKIRRRFTRQRWLAGALERFDPETSPPSQDAAESGPSDRADRTAMTAIGTFSPSGGDR